MQPHFFFFLLPFAKEVVPFAKEVVPFAKEVVPFAKEVAAAAGLFKPIAPFR